MCRTNCWLAIIECFFVLKFFWCRVGKIHFCAKWFDTWREGSSAEWGPKKELKNFTNLRNGKTLDIHHKNVSYGWKLNGHCALVRKRPVSEKTQGHKHVHGLFSNWLNDHNKLRPIVIPVFTSLLILPKKYTIIFMDCCMLLSPGATSYQCSITTTNRYLRTWCLHWHQDWSKFRKEMNLGRFTVVMCVCEKNM